ncbi:Aste57867_12099 [Aphanomyces stellatus]|uniref:Aste57867_12099 protein n=1 Tax=Aphanomyces stellatus TaxID=120398 RepID=A0A485KVG7_9STRA|nr:hypothetical protein As57867_012054 [Aphanomyces stellatus]VFT88954.1 Aste57867_12099 [Aphanomyces stellatus]
MTTTSGTACASPPSEANTPSIKHIAHCRYMADYHQAKKAERAVMVAMVERLETKRADLMRRKQSRGLLLAWRDVAKALAELRAAGEIDQEAVKAKIAQQQAIVHYMYEWVASMQPSSIETSLDAARPTWRDTSLPAHPQARHLGKAWITDHMLHNLDRVFVEYRFPALDSRVGIPMDVQVCWDNNDDDGYTMVWRSQSHVPKRLEDVIDAVRRTLFTVQFMIPGYRPDLPPIVNEVDGTTRLCAFATPANEFANVLMGEFNSADRYVVVFQEIQDDEGTDNAGVLWQHRRRRMRWAEYRRTACGTTVFRTLSLVSQPVAPTDGRKMTLEDDARILGLTLPDTPGTSKDNKARVFCQLLKDELIKRHVHYIEQRNAWA